MGWLDETTRAVAATAGLPEADLTLDAATRKEILDLARIASHSSGDRINAPLLCYALGIAAGRGASLAEVSRAVRDAAGEPA